MAGGDRESPYWLLPTLVCSAGLRACAAIPPAVQEVLERSQLIEPRVVRSGFWAPSASTLERMCEALHRTAYVREAILPLS